MSVVTVVWSLLAGSLFVGAGLVVAVTVRRRVFPDWRGSLAVTAMALVWLCWASALGQLLGAVGLLREVALLAGALASAALVVALVPAAAPVPAAALDPPPPAAGAADRPATRALTGATVVLVLFVAALWIARTAIALHRGMNDPDSLAYHLPFAVTFAHSGYADQHRLLLPLIPVQFFPAGDELLSAMALALTHSTAFAALKNVAFGGLIVVAAHALGKAFGAARLTVAAVAMVLGLPMLAFSQPGEAVNDTLLLLVLMGGLAVLAYARDRPAPYVLALGCAGLALGVKFSVIVPGAALAALAVTLLLARVPRHRWRWAGAGLLASAALGGSWYVRNAITYGNPVPPVHLAFGPLHLRTIHGPATDVAFSVAHYLARGQLLGTFGRGLLRGMGPLVLVPLALCLVGVIGGLRSADGFRRGLGAAGLAAVLGYLVTPAGAYGPISQISESFVVNLHYVAPALVFAMVAGAIVVAGRRWAWAVPTVGVVVVATGIRKGQGIAVWSPELGGPGFGLLLAAVAAAGALAWWWPSLGRRARPATVGPALMAVAALAVIAERYPTRQATNPVVAWAATGAPKRVGAWIIDVPDLINIGSLYGPRAENQVEIINRLVDGAAAPVETCPGLKESVVAGRLEFIGVTSGTAGYDWLRADPAFRIVADETVGATVDDINNLRRSRDVVFRVVGPPDVDCPGRASPGIG